MLSHFLCNSSQECIWFVFIVVHHLDLVLLGKLDIRLEEFTLLITKMKLAIQRPVVFYLCLFSKLS